MKKFGYMVLSLAAAFAFLLSVPKETKACGDCNNYGNYYYDRVYYPTSSYGSYYYSQPYYYYYSYPYYYRFTRDIRVHDRNIFLSNFRFSNHNQFDRYDRNRFDQHNRFDHNFRFDFGHRR